MERIVYKKTLDVHKNGVQFMLQGFETADKMSRRIELSLMASGDTIDFPLEQITAVMYVTTPNATEPSINACVIKDNTIIYDVLPITEEGVTQMQVELIGKDLLKGTDSVLPTPKFAVEVTKSNVDDGGATQTPTFTALEDALDRAREVYDKRFLRIELDTDCMFRAIYADGTVYESDVLKELFLKGDALLSQSYAKGGTGIRAGEDTDNSMYYSNVSKSASEDAKMVKEESAEILTEVQKHGVYTAFYIDFEKGEVEYISPSYKFNINKETGELEAIGEAYKYADIVEKYVDEWYEKQGTIMEDIERHESMINGQHGTLDTLGTKVQEHTTELGNHSTNLSILNADVETAKSDISEIKNKVATNETAISLLNADITSLNNQHNTLLSDIQEVNKTLFITDTDNPLEELQQVKGINNYTTIIFQADYSATNSDGTTICGYVTGMASAVIKANVKEWFGETAFYSGGDDNIMGVCGIFMQTNETEIIFDLNTYIDCVSFGTIKNETVNIIKIIGVC